MSDMNDTMEMTAAQMLHNARTTGRRKRELQTIAKLLCIREEFLEALEAGDYHKIPEVIYVLGFARNYAMELGLDPDEIVFKIKREMGLAPDADLDDDDVADSDMGRSESRNSMKIWFQRAWRFVVRKWMWFCGGIVALAVIVAAAVVLLHVNGTVPADVVPVVAEEVPVVTGPTYAMEIREQFGTENIETSEVVLQATQESWVKVEDARGNTVFSRVLVPGDVYYVPAGGRHRATFGNAGGIDVWVNGVLTPKQGGDHVRKAGIVLSADKLMPAAQ